MESLRPYVLTIAGHDPSGGAGITADVKVFEVHKTQGFSVPTALTFQNEFEFKAVNWVPIDDVKFQLDLLFSKHLVDHVKIGLVESIDELEALVDHILDWNSEAKIIWDPITKASLGFKFHDVIKQEQLFVIAKKLFLITPSEEEIEVLMPNKNGREGAKELSEFCNVLLKGGHNEEAEIKDILFLENGSIALAGKRSHFDKHGAGCVLSASITANLANGQDITDACRLAKDYIERFINSNDTLLGYHSN